MLDHDPNSSRPPDSRPRPRSHKPKNAPKRQPQRGLGVAQLEKLRLEEQSKQHDAAVCLQHNHHGYLPLHHQQEPHFPQQLHPFLQHEQHLQLQHQTPPPPLCISSQMKLMEPPLSFSEPRFPLPMARFGGVAHLQNSSLPLAGTLNQGQQSPPIPLLISPQQLANENETCLPPPSQVHDFCSLGYTQPSSGEGISLPLMGHPSKLTSPAPGSANYGLSLGEILWHRHHLANAPDKENGSASSSACLGPTEAEMQGPDRDPYNTTENVSAALEYLHGGPHGSHHLSMGKLHMQNEGSMAPFTDLCLRPRLIGVADLHVSQRPRLELPVIGDDVLARELSSFQTLSLCPTWLLADKASSRKRPWGCTLELVSKVETSKGLDLNTAADEIDLDTSEPRSNTPVPFPIRGSSTQSTMQRQWENNIKARFMDKSCSEACSRVTETTDPDSCVNSSGFLSLRRMSLEVETSGEFLSLGPSCSSLQILENVCVGARDFNDSPLLRESSEKAIARQSQELLCEGEHSSMDELMSPLDDHRTSYLCASLQKKVEFTDLSWNKAVRGLYQQNGHDGDLELRLSL